LTHYAATPSHITATSTSHTPLLFLPSPIFFFFFFFFNDTATTEIYTLSLHDALPISDAQPVARPDCRPRQYGERPQTDRDCHRRSEEHTSELQSLTNLVCRLLLEKKKKNTQDQCTNQYDV